jgi:hypothetical protein
VPHAYLPQFGSTGHDSMYELSRGTVKKMITQHLRFKWPPITEFSSWAASLSVALYFSNGRSDSWIAVVDTQQLPKSTRIYFTPTLKSVLGCEGFDWEYLAHGKVSGTGYTCVPFQGLVDLGVNKLLDKTYYPGCRLRLDTPLNAETIVLAKCLAEKFGRPDFTLIMTVTLLCARGRGWSSADGIPAADVETIYNCLQGGHSVVSIPRENSLTALNTVYTQRYQDVELTMLLLRALVKRHWRR